MKKIKYIILAAAMAVASLACTREEIFKEDLSQKTTRTFTCSFDDESDGDATRTEITKQGKTVWAEGDKIWVSNGTENDTLTVASEYAGKKYFEFQTTLEGTIYVVYPLSAAQGMDESGKFILQMPDTQDGTFGSANISAAVATDRYVKMKNVTSILKFRIPADAKPVYRVSVNAVDNPVVGTFTADLSSGAPVIATSDTCSVTDVIVKTDGLAGNFYAAVIPGTYKSGFSMTAVALDLDNAVESKSTSSEKVLKVNDLYDLGKIGSELKPLGGDGSQGNPYQISNLQEMLVFTYYVNAGNTMKDKFVKVTGTINNVTTPVGIYDHSDAENPVEIPFQGDFDGNGMTINLAMKRLTNKPVGLFAYFDDYAVIHDVKVAGSVSSVGDYVGGIVGWYTDSLGVVIKNCSSSATITGRNYVGGIAGQVYTNSSAAVNWTGNKIEGCSNSGSVTGEKSIGGIVGYAYRAMVSACSNSGGVTSTVNAGGASATDGTGGICGYSQNVTFSDCSNSGLITCIQKGGGICGGNYWTNINGCANSGKILSVCPDAIAYGVCGGIAGSFYVQGNVINCENTGEIVGEGGSTGWMGGIIGTAQTVHYSTSYLITVKQCRNKGKVTVTPDEGKSPYGIGGIIGYAYYANNLATYGNRVETYYCVNEADITANGTAQSAGGIIGRGYDYWSWTGGHVNNCLNTGNVTGYQYAGGVIGGYQPRSASSRIDVNNCENRGTILTKTNRAGGILGGTLAGMTNAGCGVRIDNCLNSGAVHYADASSTSPQVGGISGNQYGGRIFNCYNGGSVGLAEGTAADGAAVSTGAIAGLSNLAGGMAYVYFLEGTSANVVGSSAATKPSLLSVCSAEGVLATTMTVNSVTCSNVVDALNAWVNGNTFYYRWTTGPKYYTSGSVDIGGNLDLGNGGNL